MVAEFIRDDQDNVWFVFANKINYRRIEKQEGSQANNEVALLEALRAQQEKTEYFARELLEYEKAVAEQGDNPTIDKMRNFMDDYYTEMKNVIGIDAAMPDDEEHPHLEEAIKIIRPNMNPKAFVQMMKSENIIH